MRSTTLVLALALGTLGASADAPKPIPEVASDAQATEALVAFEEAFKAKGLKGDVKLAAQEQALWQLSQVQHATVIDRLAKMSRSTTVEHRTLAVTYLGEQRALPGLAGPEIVTAMQRNATDPVLIMAGLQALGDVGYRGVVDVLKGFFTHKDEFVVKAALLAVGDLKEMRLLDEILKLIKDLKLDKAVKWEGGEVHYDTGAAGDSDQKMAEKMYADKYGKNAGKGRGAGRVQRDMGPIVFETLKRLTGEQFDSGEAVRLWSEANKASIDTQKKTLAEEEKAQKAAGAAGAQPPR